MKLKIAFLLSYLIIFAILFFLAFYDYFATKDIIRILGFPSRAATITIICLSFLGIIKSIWHISKA